ncbi:NAD(P)-binding protein [Xylaria grammica]|nr:NAD(P)-binding protein [Xylaria grammica]
MAETPKTRLITGCSSGFGELFVRQVRALGDNVIATGRNAEKKLAHLADTGASILDLDVAAPASEINAKMTEAWNLYPNGIDVVVNNAGCVLSGGIEELTQEEMECAFKTNFHGPLNITRALLPRLRTRGNGTLLYMSSQAGQHGDPGAGAYCATKFALEGAVECLAQELALLAPEIKVLLVEPGIFRTHVFSNITYAPERVPEYAEFNASVRAFMASVIGNEPGDATKAVAVMINLVNGTGVAAGKTIPLRVPLGSDGLAVIRAKGDSIVQICDEWEEVAKSTDYKS